MVAAKLLSIAGGRWGELPWVTLLSGRAAIPGAESAELILLRKAFFLAALSAGRSRAARTATITMTTSNSMKVNPARRCPDSFTKLPPTMENWGSLRIHPTLSGHAQVSSWSRSQLKPGDGNFEALFLPILSLDLAISQSVEQTERPNRVRTEIDQDLSSGLRLQAAAALQE